MIEQWHVALACVGAVGCFWLGYWAKGQEHPQSDHDDTQNSVGNPL